ncbi:MAG: hypothetical protein ACE5JM_07400, partial [Armatimonadota bacterium]
EAHKELFCQALAAGYPSTIPRGSRWPDLDGAVLDGFASLPFRGETLATEIDWRCLFRDVLSLLSTRAGLVTSAGRPSRT